MQMKLIMNRRRKAVAATALLIFFAIPLFINGTGMEHEVRHFTPMPLGIRHASPEVHSWWLSALIMAGVIGGFLLLMMVRGILGLGAKNAAIIFATAGIIGGATLLNQQPRPMVSMSAPRCIVFGGGGGSHSGGPAAPAAAAPAAAAPAPAGVGGV